MDPQVRQDERYFHELRKRALRMGMNTSRTVTELRERLLSLAKPNDEQVLQAFLPNNLLIECEGDGACLFNGIDGLITGEFNGDRMRKLALQTFMKNPDKYRKYLDLHHDVRECPDVSKICKQNSKTHPGKILKSLKEPCYILVKTEQQYLAEMRKPSTFGTNFEMHLLAEKLQMEIMIITRNEHPLGKPPLFYNHYRFV